MLLFGRASFRHHRFWALFCVAVTFLALGWYFGYARGRSAWPGGSSPPGFVFGVIGGLIIIFESLLWVRKKMRGYRLGRTRTWMIAHIWLGLLSVPLLILHAGPTWGGPLSTILMIVFLLTILSGVWGLWVQNFLPSRIYLEVPGETIVTQIPQIMAQHLAEARELVESQCESLQPTREEVVLPEERIHSSEFLTLPELQLSGNVQGKVLTSFQLSEHAIAGTRPLRQLFDREVAVYLEHGQPSGSALANPAQAQRMFREIENVTPAAAQPILRALENLCDLRRQLDHQWKLYTWLHNWLCVHLPLTAALLVLMGVHIWAALRYW